jgi:hypothetical protein
MSSLHGDLQIFADKQLRMCLPRYQLPGTYIAISIPNSLNVIYTYLILLKVHAVPDTAFGLVGKSSPRVGESRLGITSDCQH